MVLAESLDREGMLSRSRSIKTSVSLDNDQVDTKASQLQIPLNRFENREKGTEIDRLQEVGTTACFPLLCFPVLHESSPKGCNSSANSPPAMDLGLRAGTDRGRAKHTATTWDSYHGLQGRGTVNPRCVEAQAFVIAWQESRISS